MDIFYIKARRNNSAGAEKIRVEDLIVKVDRSSEIRDGFFRGKGIISGYIDRYPINSVASLSKEQVKSILSNARENLNSMSVILESIVDSSSSKEDLMASLINSNLPTESKIQKLYTIMDGDAVSQEIYSALRVLFSGVDERLDVGLKATNSGEELNAIGVSVRPSRRQVINDVVTQHVVQQGNIQSFGSTSIVINSENEGF